MTYFQNLAQELSKMPSRKSNHQYNHMDKKFIYFGDKINLIYLNLSN